MTYMGTHDHDGYEPDDPKGWTANEFNPGRFDWAAGHKPDPTDPAPDDAVETDDNPFVQPLSPLGQFIFDTMNEVNKVYVQNLERDEAEGWNE